MVLHKRIRPQVAVISADLLLYSAFSWRGSDGDDRTKGMKTDSKGIGSGAGCERGENRLL